MRDIFSRRRWIKIHRFVGLFSVFFLFLIAVSGLTLSFSEELNLEERTTFWGMKSVQFASHQIAIKGDQVFFDEQNTNIRCTPPVAGITEANEKGFDSVMLVCQNILYWLTWDGGIVESINVPKTLSPISKAYMAENLTLDTASGLFGWDLAQSELVPLDMPQYSPEPLISIHSQGSSLAQWVLNLHTGLVAGELGRWFMRFAGIGLLILCISGLKNALRN